MVSLLTKPKVNFQETLLFMYMYSYNRRNSKSSILFRKDFKRLKDSYELNILESSSCMSPHFYIADLLWYDINNSFRTVSCYVGLYSINNEIDVKARVYSFKLPYTRN